tara:strand:- start:733 stop:2580 length:1848 start_codon:yes stop_codon:yes gene_type:complete
MKNKFLIATLCLGLLTVYFACEKDDTIVKEEQTLETSRSQSQDLPTIKRLSYGNAGEKFNHLKNTFGLDSYLDITRATSSNIYQRTSDTSGIIIYTNVIKEVSKEGYTSYTMYMETSDSDDSKFYNLTLEEKNGVEDNFVTKYEPTQQWLANRNQEFDGFVTVVRAVNLENPSEVIAGGSNGGFDPFVDTCNGTVISTTIFIPYQCTCGPAHWPGQTCNPQPGCSPPGSNPYTTYECIPTNPIDPNTGGNGNPLSNGSGNAGDDTNDIPYTDEEQKSFNAIVDKDEVIYDEEECDIDTTFYDRINALENSEDINAIYNYLSANNDSCDASDFVKEALDALENDGEVDFDDAINLDETVINNQKLKCVYDKLKSLSNTYFKDVIQSQFGSSNSNHIKIEIGNIPAQLNINTAFTYTTYVKGSTLDFEQGNTKYIRFDSNYIQGASTLEIARALLHEFIHAELMDRCIKLGLVQEIGLLGETLLVSNQTLYTLPQIIFNNLLLQYNAYEPGNSPNANPQWNHDLFNALSYRSDLAQDLVSLHALLNDSNNDFLTNVNNDPNIVGGPYTIAQIMDYKSWAGLEGTSDYTNTIANIPTELAKLNYLESMFSTDYNHNCN